MEDFHRKRSLYQLSAAGQAIAFYEEAIGRRGQLQSVALRVEADAAKTMYEALRETAGAAVEELYRQLEEVRREAEQRDAAERAARGREQHAPEERGKADGERGRSPTSPSRGRRHRRCSWPAP